MGKLSVSLFLTAVILSLLGIFMLYESSTYTAQLSIGDKFYFFKNQLVWFAIGVFSCILVSNINYKNYYRFALPLLLGSLGLLILVFLPEIGLKLKGAHRWINLGIIVLQPSEVLKITLTMYLAAWLSIKEKARLIAFLMLVCLSVFLVVIEPDLGTALTIATTAMVVYFLSGAPFRDMVLIVVAMIIGLFFLIRLEPYRVERLIAYQNFDAKNLSGASYHVKQILVALGSGGATGVGLGNSVQKYLYLPEGTTDSIFAIFAEETGFIGSTILISLFIFLTFLGFTISTHAPDLFGKLLSAGIITFISIQAFINLASQTVLIPLTGIPLPFISYGGSSLIINFISIGILLNISRGERK